MSSPNNDSSDDLVPVETKGYVPGTKKTLDEYKNLDSNDESLNKWKESLGISSAGGQETAPTKVDILSLGLEIEGRDDIIIDLSDKSPAALDEIKKKPIVIKEGVSYILKIRFKVLNDIVCGLKFLQSYKRHGLSTGTIDCMIGSYGPSDKEIEIKFPKEEAPQGMLARGKYTANCKFIDDDKTTYLKFSWLMEIKKDW
ncbi:rho GDP dissociation inhibitor [Mycoemilia scoparia]|uniref:Rho GDP dissociation inhibitor n=1 Tax=Mycoemilia scoparia TaxID=417184 RepID=A0A9W8A5J7_9FUNG|nr:rho GDP dissociation inhibitor [Mycoemilia scoparia]